MALTSFEFRNRNAADSSAGQGNMESAAEFFLLEGGNQHCCTALLPWNSPNSHCAEAPELPLQMEKQNHGPRTLRRVQLPPGYEIRHVLQV